MSSIVRDSRGEFELCSFCCDYEQAIINSLSDEFRGAVHVGCQFHWKQGNRRKLLELRVPLDMISKLMGEHGLINFLCVLSYEEISKEIAYIRFKMEEGSFVKLFDQYWRYFLKTWMRKTRHHQDKTGLYLFTSWNIFHLIDKNGEITENEDGVDVMVNRTNNPLERFNRRMNESIPIHPTMQVFVQGIKDICNDYVDQMVAAKLQRGRKQGNHAPVNVPEIPADFKSFVYH